MRFIYLFHLDLSICYLGDGSILEFSLICTDFEGPSLVDFRLQIQRLVRSEEGDCVQQQDPD